MNVVNVLATQFGEYCSNVGDITGALSPCSTDDTLIWVGTENRQSVLGHVSLLGVQGEPVVPMAAAGPAEGYLGEPVWSSLAEWADSARRGNGLAITAHFPFYYGEVAADIILGKIDAVELHTADPMKSWTEWYRYLNCGYRVPAVGGTDKMEADRPVGGVRTYALLEPDTPLTFDSWVAAVRRGRTFVTTEPLLELTVDGCPPGADVEIDGPSRRLHAEVRVESFVPVHRVELIVNGDIVEARQFESGTLSCTFGKDLTLSTSAWIAARCISDTVNWIGSTRRPAAHTSPIYVSKPDSILFSPADAQYMKTLLEGGLTWLDTLSIPSSPEAHARARQVFLDALAHICARLAGPSS